MITERSITEARPDALPSILVELARLTALATLRLTAVSAAPAVEQADRLLTADEAAPLTGLSPKQLARNRTLPFRRVVSPRVVRYSSRGIERWLKRAS